MKQYPTICGIKIILELSKDESGIFFTYQLSCSSLEKTFRKNVKNVFVFSMRTHKQQSYPIFTIDPSLK